MPRNYVRKTDSVAVSQEFRSLPFWERVSRQSVIDSNGCYLFTGAKDQCGYGRIADNRNGKGNKLIRLHRAVWEREHGEIPEGMVICHTCDVRNCINPAHLFMDTQAGNIRDMDRKNRRKVIIGEKRSTAKLTDVKVLAIKSMLLNGATCAHIARLYDVSEGLIRHIKKERIWAHVKLE